MRTIQIPLDRIQDNPWQTRRTYDPDAIRRIAHSILRIGLKQPPTGRLVNQLGDPPNEVDELLLASQADIDRLLAEVDGAGIQLAFGHSRKRALDLIATWIDAGQRPPTEDEQERGGTAVDLERGDLPDGVAAGYMPLFLDVLTDAEMAELAWTENEARSDLSPLEEAYAIQTRMEDFELTQAQVAKSLGMGRSTVSNKLRLLELDDDILDQVDDGTISERVASALLPLHRVPNEVRVEAEEDWRMNSYDDGYAGATSTKLRSDVKDAIKNVSVAMQDAEFPIDARVLALPAAEEVAPDDAVRHPTCEGCPLRFAHNGDDRCGDLTCFRRKKEIWDTHLIERAQETTGLDYHTSLGWKARREIENSRVLEHAKTADGGPCENLILYQGTWGTFQPTVEVGDDEHEAPCHFACFHGPDGSCACRQAVMDDQDVEQATLTKKSRERNIIKRIKDHLMDQVRPVVEQADLVLCGVIGGLPDEEISSAPDTIRAQAMRTVKWRMPSRSFGDTPIEETVRRYRTWARRIEELAAETGFTVDGRPLQIDVCDPEGEWTAPPDDASTLHGRVQACWSQYQNGMTAPEASRMLKTIRGDVGRRQAWLGEDGNEGTPGEADELAALHQAIDDHLNTVTKEAEPLLHTNGSGTQKPSETDDMETDDAQTDDLQADDVARPEGYGTVDGETAWDLLHGDRTSDDLTDVPLATLIVTGMVLGSLPDGYRDGLATDVRQEIRSRGQGHQALAYSGAPRPIQESIRDECQRIKQDLDALEPHAA